MQSEILAAQPTARVATTVVWFSVLGGDQKAAVDASLMTDPRVAQYWDDDGDISEFFADHASDVGLQIDGLLWDAYLLFGPGAHWGDIPEPLAGFGGPVVAETGRIALQLQQVLKEQG